MTLPNTAISWTGEFMAADLERSFATWSTGNERHLAYLCMLATCGTCASFAPMDLLMLEGRRFWWFLGDRALILLVSVAALLAVARVRELRAIRWLTYTQLYAFFSLNALIFDHPALTRHGALLLPFSTIGLFMFVPGRFRPAARLSAFAPAISLLFWGVLRPQPESPHDLAMIVLITAAAYLTGGVARSQLNRVRREEYLLIERERQTNHKLLEAKEAAEAGARAKADFLAVMSHEIRTPLNGILGMVRLTLDSPLAKDDRERLETATQSAEFLQTILDDILDLSKLEAGQLQFDNTPFRLRAAIEDVTRLMAHRARQKQLELRLDVAPGLPDWIVGDGARLRQILFNLVGNAVKFTEAGSIRVQVRPVSRADGTAAAEFSVIDTGIGIAPDQQQRIFHAFTQADASISRRFGGTGLGLQVCMRLVQGLGGELGVESTLGQGSCFRFRLPIVPAEARGQSVEMAPIPPMGCLSILLVEDNDVNLEVARGFLGKEGHAVSIARDGAEAVAMVAKMPFDLVLMDMRMPVVDGLEATRRIRKLPGPGRNVPIIALTANATVQDRERCLAAGMNGHLAKPIDRKSLLSAIAGAKADMRFAVPSCHDILVVGGKDTAVQALRHLRHRVFPIPQASSALTMLASRRFDLVMVGAPEGVPAEEFAAQVEALPYEPPIPVVRLDGSMEAVDGEALDRLITRRLPPQLAAAKVTQESPPEAGVEDFLPPERLKELRGLLVSSLMEQVRLLQQSDLPADTLEEAAHKIRGSAANMRLSDLSRKADITLSSLRVWRDAHHRLETSRQALVEAISQFAGEASLHNAQDATLPTGDR